MEPSKGKVVKVQSVSAARKKSQAQTNKYINKYGEMEWMAAMLTAYQGGGYEELKKNYNDVPLKYMKMLIDAYRYKATELELSIAQAASRPHMKKGDSQKYMQSLTDRLEGKR